MPGAYAEEHADALADIREAAGGASLIIERPNVRVHNAATDRFSAGTAVTIAGAAFEDEADPDEYADATLDINTMPTLVFCPDAYPLKAHTPEFVQPGDKLPWNGINMNVKRIYPLAPDGYVITARLIVGV